MLTVETAVRLMQEGSAKNKKNLKIPHCRVLNLGHCTLRTTNKFPVFRIRFRMDPDFFANPDPGLKSPDPDPSIYKLM